MFNGLQQLDLRLHIGTVFGTDQSGIQFFPYMLCIDLADNALISDISNGTAHPAWNEVSCKN